MTAAFRPQPLLFPPLPRPTIKDLQRFPQVAGRHLARTIHPQEIEKDDSPEDPVKFKVVCLMNKEEGIVPPQVYAARISELKETPLGYQHAVWSQNRIELLDWVASLVYRPLPKEFVPIDFPGLVIKDDYRRRFPSLHVTSQETTLRWTSLEEPRTWGLVAVADRD